MIEVVGPNQRDRMMGVMDEREATDDNHCGNCNEDPFAHTSVPLIEEGSHLQPRSDQAFREQHHPKSGDICCESYEAKVSGTWSTSPRLAVSILAAYATTIVMGFPGPIPIPGRYLRLRAQKCSGSIDAL